MPCLYFVRQSLRYSRKVNLGEYLTIVSMSWSIVIVMMLDGIGNIDRVPEIGKVGVLTLSCVINFVLLKRYIS